MSVSDVVSATKIGIEVCVKYLAPTKNLRKGIEQQAIITDMVFDNAQYFDEETQNHLETMQQALDFKMSAVAAGQATVSWSHIFQHPSCITRARSFASLTAKRLVETRVSANAKREYQRQHKTTVSSESLSINLENVELSRGTKSIELPFPLQKDYIVSATFRLRPADDANGASVASLDSAQSVTLNGMVDLIEHALSEGSDGGLPDLEVAFREMSCTVAE